MNTVSEESLELACRDYEVIVVDLDDTLTLATSLEEFLGFHLQRKYGLIGKFKIKLASIVLKALKALGLQSEILLKIYVDFLLLGERYRDLKDSALLYIYSVIKERRVRRSILNLLEECRRNSKTLILATGNVDLVASFISKYLGFHYFVSSEVKCNLTCRLRCRIVGPRKVLEMIKLIKKLVKDVDKVAYIADKWSITIEGSRHAFKNVIMVNGR